MTAFCDLNNRNPDTLEGAGRPLCEDSYGFAVTPLPRRACFVQTASRRPRAYCLAAGNTPTLLNVTVDAPGAGQDTIDAIV